MTTNLINGKRYIGKDKHNNPSYLGSGVLLLKAIRKHGKNNFKKTIIDTAKTMCELDEKEKYWIEKYSASTDDNFYNIAVGGSGGNIVESARKKISEALMGHVHSEQTKQKIREKAIGRKVSQLTKEKMSIAQKSIDKYWLKNYTKGKDNPRSKPVLQFSREGVFIKRWDYAKKAIEELGMSYTDITNCISGRQKTAGGFIWKGETFDL